MINKIKGIIRALSFNVDKLAEEIIWYGEKKNGKYIIPIVIDFDFCLTCRSSWIKGTFIENPHAFDTLKKWEEKYNCGFILETMRGEKKITPALDFIKKKGINLYGIGRNPTQGSDEDLSCKAWGIFNIDDRDMNIPLVYPKNNRPYVDWKALDDLMSLTIKKIHDRIIEVEDRVLKAKKIAEETHKAVKIDYSY